jgi:hypothetical protein
METITTILTFVGYAIMIPIWIIAILLIIFAIMGAVKKDFTKFKKALKIWGYFWLAFLVLLVVFFITRFFA